MAPSTSNIPALIAGLCFLALLLLVFGVAQYLRQYSARHRLLDRIRGSSTDAAELDMGEDESTGGESTSEFILSFFGSLGRRVVKEDSEDYTRTKLKFLHAGLRQANMPIVFWGIRATLTILLPMAVFILNFVALNFSTTQNLLFACLAAALCGFYGPELWLRNRIIKRRTEITRGLPDVLDLLVVCVEAGTGMDSAMLRVADEIALTHEALNDELRIYNLEVRAGRTREEALERLSMRIGLEDMQNLVTLLIQTDRFGTSLADALRVYSETFRTRRYRKAEEAAGKLSAKMMFPLILLIFPGLFVAIIGSVIVRFIRIIWG